MLLIPRKVPGIGWILIGLFPILIATLSPQSEPVIPAGFAFELPRRPSAWIDVAQNVLLYVPLGLILAARQKALSVVLASALGLSLAIELLQLTLVAGRHPAARDVITNTLGALLGAWLATRFERTCQTLMETSEHYVRRALRAEGQAAGTLALTWALMVSAVVLGTGWLMAPAPPPPYFYAVMAPYIDSSRGPLRIGSDRNPGTRFSGVIDEVRIYSTALNAGEIQHDMREPVSSTKLRPSLVAAYGFESGTGRTAVDDSGHGHDGAITDATWTEGRIGRALMFDGKHAHVLIASDTALDLREAMTIEAWIRPVGQPVRWPAIIARDGDTYYLVASSDMGDYRPAGGIRFSRMPEFLVLRTPIVPEEWTHLALTYDGQAIRLFVNGELAVMRLHWSTHHPRRVELNGNRLSFGGVNDPARFVTTMLGDFKLRFTLVCGSHPARGPVFAIAGVEGMDVLTVQAEGRDLWVNWSSRSHRLGLASPGYHVPQALRDCDPGREIDLLLSGPLQNPRLERDGAALRGSRPGPGSAWGFVLRAELIPAWARTAITAVWIAILFVPLGFWMRGNLRALAAVVIVVASVVLAERVWGAASPDPGHIAAAALSVAAGAFAWLFTDAFRRVSAASPS